MYDNIRDTLSESTVTTDLKGPGEILQDLKLDNLNRVILGHLNINSIRNKFEELKTLIIGKIDILIISETKIDNTFPLVNLVSMVIQNLID